MRPSLSLSGLLLTTAALAGLQAAPLRAADIGHVKAFDANGEEMIRIKALKDGKEFNVKILKNNACSNQNSSACLHSVKALVDGQQLPVKAIRKEANGRVSIKAITASGELLDIKGITAKGEIVDIKASPVLNSRTHGVKGHTKDGTTLHVKGFDKAGNFHHIKAVTNESSTTPQTVNGVQYWGDIKALSY